MVDRMSRLDTVHPTRNESDGMACILDERFTEVRSIHVKRVEYIANCLCLVLLGCQETLRDVCPLPSATSPTQFSSHQ